MSGIDSAISTLLAARSELFQSALRAASGSTPGQTATQASVANAATSTPDTYGPGIPGAVAMPVPSAQTALSSVARTLDVISRLGGSAPAVLGDAPLWPVPPRPASAFAALTTGLFDTAFSSNAAAVAAARAASQNMPPLPSAQIATQLAKTVDESGLFYEAHLAQWIAGQRTTASLGSEPQARIDPRALTLPLDFSSDSQMTGVPLLDDAPRPPAAPTPSPDSHVPTPQNPQQAAELAASVRDAPVSAFSTPPSTTTAAAHDAQHQTALQQASIDAGINPATLNTVRQQLDLLANGQFRWQGEAWPGTRFDWEIERDAREPAEDTSVERTWRTRVTLSLPALGMVDAELVMSGDKLTARIRATDAGASRLAGDGSAFARRLEAAGIALSSFSVRSMDGSAEFDENGDTRRAAAKPVPSPLAHLFGPAAAEGEGA